MDLHRFAREHHVHYDVLPEEIARGQGRQIVGYDVRLFASHDRERLSIPDCPACRGLRRELSEFAQGVLPPGDPGAPPSAEIVPDPSALYQASHEAERDEVALTIRVGPTAPGAGQDDPVFSRLRENLEAAGARLKE